MINFKRVNEKLYRSGFLNKSDIDWIINNSNIRKIISLDMAAGNMVRMFLNRHPRGKEIKHIMLPITFSSNTVRNAAIKLQENNGHLFDPVVPGTATLIHCQRGIDRTGFAVAIYRVKKNGWNPVAALAEAKQFGYGSGISPEQQKFMNVYIGVTEDSTKVTRKNLLDKIIKLALIDKFAGINDEIKKKDPQIYEFIKNKLEKVFGPKAFKFIGIIYKAIINFLNQSRLSYEEAKKSLISNTPEIFNEILDDAIFYCKEFEKVSSNLKEKDITKYKTYKEFKEAIELARLHQAEKAEQINKQKKYNKLLGGVSIEGIKIAEKDNNVTKIYEDDERAVYRINNVRGSYALANDTSWCVTRPDQGYYNQYTSSNLIFYFVINKVLELSDPYQKVAIRAIRDGTEVINLQCTRKTNDGDNYDPETIPGWDLFKDKLIEDANNQPVGLLFKITEKDATIEDFNKLWDSYKDASVDEKSQLITFIRRNTNYYFEKSPQIKNFISLLNDNVKASDIIKSLGDNWIEKADAATLEIIAERTNDGVILDKLWKTKYNSVKASVIKNTKNLKILSEAAVSNYNNFLESLAANNNAPISILNKAISNPPQTDDSAWQDTVISKCINSFIKSVNSNEKPYNFNDRVLSNLPFKYFKFIKEPSSRVIRDFLYRYYEHFSCEDYQDYEDYYKDFSFQSQIKPQSLMLKLSLEDFDWLLKKSARYASMVADYINELPDEYSDRIKILIKEYPYYLLKLENPSEELQVIAIESAVNRYADDTAIELISGLIKKNITPGRQLQLLIAKFPKTNAYLLFAATTVSSLLTSKQIAPIEELQLEAVKEVPDIIKLFDKFGTSEEVQLAAVQKDPTVIRFISNPTPKVLDKIKDVNIRQLILEKEKKEDEFNINYIKKYKYESYYSNIVIGILKLNPTEAVQMAAVESDPRFLTYIKNPTPKVIEYVKNLKKETEDKSEADDAVTSIRESGIYQQQGSNSAESVAPAVDPQLNWTEMLMTPDEAYPPVTIRGRINLLKALVVKANTKSAVIIKGEEKPGILKFVKDLKRFLAGLGYTVLVCSYTDIPPLADLWIGQGEGVESLRAAPQNTKLLALKSTSYLTQDIKQVIKVISEDDEDVNNALMGGGPIGSPTEDALPAGQGIPPVGERDNYQGSIPGSNFGVSGGTPGTSNPAGLVDLEPYGAVQL